MHFICGAGHNLSRRGFNEMPDCCQKPYQADAFTQRNIQQPVNATGLRRAVLLNDLSCFGKCSLTVGLPILSAAGVEALPLPTAVLSTHTGGFSGYTCMEMTQELERIAAHWQTLALQPDAIATGYFCSAAQIDFSSAFVKSFAGGDTLLLVDPVMADGGALYAGFDGVFAQKMSTLCAGADVITPNLTEALLLARLPYTDSPDAALVQECFARLQKLGAKRIIITGVQKTPALEAMPCEHIRAGRADTAESGREIGCLCTDADGRCFAVWHPYVHTALHGCGDVFSAAFLAAALTETPQGERPLADENAFCRAVHTAACFTSRCVQATASGEYPGHWYGLRFEPCLAQGFRYGVQECSLLK